MSFKGSIINVRKRFNIYKRKSDCKDKDKGVSALQLEEMEYIYKIIMLQLFSDRFSEI